MTEAATGLAIPAHERAGPGAALFVACPALRADDRSGRAPDLLSPLAGPLAGILHAGNHRNGAEREDALETIRWGILGTGRIAATFATALEALPDAELAAVGSRAAETAAGFAQRFGARRSHASYADLANDPGVDIIYIATPHSGHYANSRLCLEAGKGVLCEKPFTLNATQARELVRLARERRLFLMEAMWTRFLPALAETRRLIAEGAIGEPQFLIADFGFNKEFDPRHRLFDPERGGGALLDVGVYLVSHASMLFGTPAQISSWAHIGPAGVDERAALLFGYEGGRFAQLTTAITADTPQEATIAGSAGSIRLQAPWWKATSLTVASGGSPPYALDAPYVGNGYTHEAMEAMRCLRTGAVESPLLPLAETIAVIETLDRIRASWGLRYPGEEGI
ncbi:MAG: Gfo/Idh/MocA family oxidoreductase [Thermomicrobiales bacterium]